MAIRRQFQQPSSPAPLIITSNTSVAFQHSAAVATTLTRKETSKQAEGEGMTIRQSIRSVDVVSERVRLTHMSCICFSVS